MREPIFVSAYLQDKIWGGQKLGSEFGYDLPTDTVGEAWVISAHPHGESTIVRPAAYAGMPLSDFYQEYPEYFSGTGQTLDKFPLLVKILDAREDLSVQVHPDDAYGLAHEGELGKTECWYIMAADPGSEIVYGHQAQSREEFIQMIEADEWDKLLHRVPVQKGDFFYVPAGTVHAIGSGIVILETQQNSDTTYRLYDYGRLGDDGQPRNLHIQQSADVVHYPARNAQADPRILKEEGASRLTHLIEEPYFSVWKWEIAGNLSLDLSGPYTLVTLIEGAGEIVVDGQAYQVQTPDSFILPQGVDRLTAKGNFVAIASCPMNEV